MMFLIGLGGSNLKAKEDYYNYTSRGCEYSHFWLGCDAESILRMDQVL